MEYESSSDPQHPHILIFSHWETGTVQAAFVEENINNEQKGNSGRGTGFENNIILDPEITSTMRLRLAGFQDLIEILEDFIERTDEEAREISYLPVPKFENTGVARRRRLGEWATDLLFEIKKIKDEVETEAASEKIIQEFHQQLEEELPDI
jgi:hypothetical protein